MRVELTVTPSISQASGLRHLTEGSESHWYSCGFPDLRGEPCLNAVFNVGPADSHKYNTFNASSTNPGFTDYRGIRHPTWHAVRQLGFRTGEERSALRVSYVRSGIWCGPRN